MVSKVLHAVLNGEIPSKIPFWFMRQAGRYLPEYREIRANSKGFLDLCYNPEKAAEVTLQPIRRFDMDAAIVFSDILVIPHAMGRQVEFLQGEGPKLNPIRNLQDVEQLSVDVEKHLLPICETLKRVRVELSQTKTLIGFCGAPWTVASYMIEGGSSKQFESAKRFAWEQKNAFALLLDRIVEASARYLIAQIDAGADVLQIFDSWAGVLSEQEFAHWSIAPTKALLAKVKAARPHVPIIGFPRACGVLYADYANQTGVDAVSIDFGMPLAWAKTHISKPLQGNLDPILLACDKAAAIDATKNIISTLQGKPFIFNLGHGMIPSTPIENIQAVCDVIRSV